MSIVTTLTQIYENKGLRPLTGYNSHHFFNWKDAPFTVLSQGQGIIGCPGLALQEIMFLEHLGKYLTPKNCLVIGNAMGWSTLATGLTFPNAKTLAIDNSAKDGIAFTNDAFTELEINGKAVLAESPKDIAHVCDSEFEGQLDFVLIDALHNNKAIQADFHAVHKHASPECVYLFHDVINWDMLDGFSAILKDSGLQGKVLTRTPSGMAIAYGENIPKACLDYISVFSDDAEFFKKYRNTVRHSFEPLAFFESKLP